VTLSLGSRRPVKNLSMCFHVVLLLPRLFKSW
jgi:hypothetical protein